MKITFKKVPGAPLWWEAVYDVRRSGPLNELQIAFLIKKLSDQFPSVRYKIFSSIFYASYKLRDTNERIYNTHRGDMHFQVCFTSKEDLSYFMIWANGGIDL